MATPPNPPRNRNSSLPPRRGSVKAQIFESFAEKLSSAAAKAVLVLAKVQRGSATASDTSASASASTSASASASASPPASAYTSEGYPDQA